jgi:hypothetical protein
MPSLTFWRRYYYVTTASQFQHLFFQSALQAALYSWLFDGAVDFVLISGPSRSKMGKSASGNNEA